MPHLHDDAHDAGEEGAAREEHAHAQPELHVDDRLGGAAEGDPEGVVVLAPHVLQTREGHARTHTHARTYAHARECRRRSWKDGCAGRLHRRGWRYGGRLRA